MRGRRRSTTLHSRPRTSVPRTALALPSPFLICTFDNACCALHAASCTLRPSSCTYTRTTSSLLCSLPTLACAQAVATIVDKVEEWVQQGPGYICGNFCGPYYTAGKFRSWQPEDTKVKALGCFDSCCKAHDQGCQPSNSPQRKKRADLDMADCLEACASGSKSDLRCPSNRYSNAVVKQLLLNTPWREMAETNACGGWPSSLPATNVKPEAKATSPPPAPVASCVDLKNAKYCARVVSKGKCDNAGAVQNCQASCQMC
jgi:hypothetical protein